MIKARKVVISCLLAAMAVTGVAGTAANAGTKWTDGLYNGHNGYYMAYGYYYDGQTRHYSWASLGGHSTGNKWAPAGQTTDAKTDSYQDTDWDADFGY
jgi:hypothetical protein